MPDPANATLSCQLIGEYVDEAELPANLAHHRGEVVRPRVVADHLDLWGRENGFKEFTVLLQDGRTVAVRGQDLRLIPSAETGQGQHYGVLARTGSEEVLVALFKTSEVVGIFHGALRSDRKNA